LKVLWSLLLFVTFPAWACAILDPKEQRLRDKEDVELQVQLAKDLARKSDTVFIGRVVNIDGSPSLAEVAVERAIKGEAAGTVRLPVNGLKDLTVSCRASDMFRNSQVVAGRRYLFYVQGGAVLRAGWATRASGHVSLQGELRAVRQADGT
jgi:hypothetical protein